MAAFQFQASTILANASVNRSPRSAENERAVLCRADRFRLPDDRQEQVQEERYRVESRGYRARSADEDAESQAKEKERLEKYAEWLEKGGE